MLAIATNIPHAIYDWFCDPGSNINFSLNTHIVSKTDMRTALTDNKLY